jgi:peroxiredoxin
LSTYYSSNKTSICANNSRGAEKKVDALTNSLKKGEVVAPVVGADLSGQPYELKYKEDGRRHLLMFFSPDCRYCAEQAPLWRDVLNKIDSNRFNVVGVVGDREGTQAVSAHAGKLGYFSTKTPLPVMFFNEASLARYKLTATPTTLLINDHGKIEHVWVGKWDETKANEVSLALK